MNFTQILIQTSRPKTYCKTLRAFLIKEFQLVLILNSICSRTNILQNRIKYAILDFKAAVEYGILSEYKFAMFCSGSDTPDRNRTTSDKKTTIERKNTTEKTTIVIWTISVVTDTNIIACLLQM